MGTINNDGNGPQTAFVQRNLNLLITGDYHDFIIECGGRQFKVHRCIVCPQSSMLRSLCKPIFKEGFEGHATLEDHSADVFQHVLKFMYTGSYEDGFTQATDSPLRRQDSGNETPKSGQGALANAGIALLLNVQVYVLADFLDVGPLKQLALQKSSSILDHHFDADTYADAIAEALSCTNTADDSLRLRLIQSCVKSFDKVRSSTKLEQVIIEHEALAWRLLVQEQNRHGEEVAQLRSRHADTVAALATQLDNLSTQRTNVERELATAKRAADNAREDLAQVVKLVNNHEECQNVPCRKWAGIHLETTSSGGVRMLRCKKCRSKLEYCPPSVSEGSDSFNMSTNATNSWLI